MFHSMISLLRILAVIMAAIAVLCMTSCSDSTETYTVETTVTSSGTVIKKPKVTTRTRLRQAAAAPGPKVTVPRPTHDFGQMDPLTQGMHAFVIRNTGDSVLELQQGPTTCKCTLSKLDRTVLQPGEQAKAIVTWNSGRDLVYRHQATVFSNDPRNKAITLTIKGRVRVLLGCEPKELVFSRIEPEQTPAVTTIVYSQNWNAMKLTSVHTSMPGWNWYAEPATTDELGPLRARSGYRVTISPPKGIQPGYFMTSFAIEAEQLDVQQDEQAESAKCELVASGKALRRLTVFGRAIDATGTVELGRVLQDKGKSVRLLLKVRDDQKMLVVDDVKCDPAFLNVRVQPYKNNGAKIGLYQLLIDVPRNAPIFYLSPNQHGSIRLTFDHPRVKQLALTVDLRIVQPNASQLTRLERE